MNSNEKLYCNNAENNSSLSAVQKGVTARRQQDRPISKAQPSQDSLTIHSSVTNCLVNEQRNQTLHDKIRLSVMSFPDHHHSKF